MNRKNSIISSTSEQIPGELLSEPIGPDVIMGAKQKVVCGQSCNAEKIHEYSPILNTCKSCCLDKAVSSCPTEHKSRSKVVVTSWYPRVTSAGLEAGPGLLWSTWEVAPSGGGTLGCWLLIPPFLQTPITSLTFGTAPF